jgi:metallo-beta-lactamase family protein
MHELRDEELGIHGLVDCGSFQGCDAKGQCDEWGFEPAELQFVLLTHAHLDHCGRLPALAAAGFRGTIICTAETRELAIVLLKDGAKLSAQRDGEVMTGPDGRDGLDILMNDITWDTSWRPDGSAARALPLTGASGELRMRMLRSSHLLGAVGFVLSWTTVAGKLCTTVFYGDSGAEQEDGCAGLLCAHNEAARVELKECDRLSVVVESTYGARESGGVGRAERLEALKQLMMECEEDGKSLAIPAFSLGRTQDVLFDIAVLRHTVPELAHFKVYTPARGTLGDKASQIYARCLVDTHALNESDGSTGHSGSVYANRQVWASLGMDIDTPAGAEQARAFLRGAFGLDGCTCGEDDEDGYGCGCTVPWRRNLKEVDALRPRTVVVGGSGMGDHAFMRWLLPLALRDDEALIGLVGYGAPGSLVGQLRRVVRRGGPTSPKNRTKSLKLPHGGHVNKAGKTTGKKAAEEGEMSAPTIRAGIHEIPGYSGHAGARGLLHLAFQTYAKSDFSLACPHQVFLIHGTPESGLELATHMKGVARICHATIRRPQGRTRSRISLD